MDLGDLASEHSGGDLATRIRGSAPESVGGFHQSRSASREEHQHGRAIRVRLEDERVERFKDKVETAEAKAIYRQRSPHAWLKCKLNFVRFRCRGMRKATAEAFWVCLTHNLQRYFGQQRLPAA